MEDHEITDSETSSARATSTIGLRLSIAARRSRDENSAFNRAFVQDRETLCAGIIAGGSLAGITLILLETLVLH